MRMLESETPDSDATVTHLDQANINAFSKLNSRLDDVESSLLALTRELEEVEEVELEVEMVEEDELLLYKLDTTLLHLPASRVLSLLQTSLVSLRSRTASLEAEKEECEEGMMKLKEVLYKKFGGTRRTHAPPYYALVCDQDGAIHGRAADCDAINLEK